MLMSYFILGGEKSELYFIFANIVPDFEVFHLASQPSPFSQRDLLVYKKGNLRIVVT